MTIPPPFICPSALSADEYHAQPGLSSTIAKEIIGRTPMHARHRRDEPLDSAALVLGDALHCKVLRPDRFDAEFRVLPKVDRRTKAGKAVYAEAEQDALRDGATLLTTVQAVDTQCMAGAVSSHAGAAAALAAAPMREVSLRAEIRGVPVRARYDAIGDDIVVDLKTTSGGLSDGEIARAAATFGWGVQQAFYEAVLHAAGEPVRNTFAFVVVEKSAPWGVRVVTLDRADIDLLHERVDEAIDVYAECERRGEWPGYDDHASELPLPVWYSQSIARPVVSPFAGEVQA